MPVYDDQVVDPSTVVENDGPPIAEGGVILWGSEPPEDDDNFIVRLRLRDGRHTWSSAWKSDIHDNGVDYELAHAEDEDLIGAEIVGYCRGPDPSGSVAYHLHEKPGEGLGS